MDCRYGSLFCLLLMAVKVYKLSVSSLLLNLLIMLVGLLVIIALAAILGWLISMRQNRKKFETESRNKSEINKCPNSLFRSLIS